MSYQQFRQRCLDCGHEWNDAFGIIGTTQIATPLTCCPVCRSVNIVNAGYGWKWATPEGSKFCSICGVPMDNHPGACGGTPTYDPQTGESLGIGVRP